MAKTKDRFSDATDTMKPIVERALRDERLRDDVQSAFAVARKVYDEIAGSGDVGKAATRVARDKRLQQDLREAVQDLRDAAQRLQGKERASTARSRRLLVAGIALGILFNPVTGPGARRFLKELVTGGDEFGGDIGSGSSNGA